MAKSIFNYLACLVFLGLAGCSATAPPKDIRVAEALERIEQLRAEALQARPGLRAVAVRRAEAWLANPLAARYANLRADHAFRLVAQGRPVRFNFPTGAAPVVRWPPQARTIRHHMDSIAAQADWRYEVKRNVIQVSDIETRHFVLSAQPGKTESKLGLRNLAGSASGSADNIVELALDPYTGEIVQAIQGVLGIGSAGQSADGAGISSIPALDPRTRVTIAPSANLLIVTSKPYAMRQVEQVMNRYNESVSAIVRIELSIIEVEFEDVEQHELLVRLLRASGNLPLSLVLGVVGDGASAAAGPVQPDDLTDSIIAGGSRYIGSSVIFEWLDTFGDASIAYDDTIEVLNNHMASVDVTRTEQYVSKISLGAVGDGNTVTPEIEFEKLRTGLVLHLQPTVVNDRITLRMGMSRSTPVGRVPYAFLGISGTNFITQDFNRVLSVSLADGKPKLLSSFSETATRGKRKQVPYLGPFGRGKDRTERRRETVMLITASLVGN